jgi:hypothetical protein
MSADRNIDIARIFHEGWSARLSTLGYQLLVSSGCGNTQSYRQRVRVH